MATEKQIVANQQNAQHSTGPRTESGKRHSRRNAVRHGLTAETVIDTLEDAADYRAFERAIKSDFSPQTAIEGQLVSRLASLLWRLRRAVIIESGLLNIQAGRFILFFGAITVIMDRSATFLIRKRSHHFIWRTTTLSRTSHITKSRDLSTACFCI
jgi:hypothetical protein